MSQSLVYDGTDLGTTVVRLGTEQGFTEIADHGAYGTTELVFDDPDGTLGVGADAIGGDKTFYVSEGAVSSSTNRQLWTGYTGARTYRRGSSERTSLRTGIAREVSCTLNDLNVSLAFRVVSSSGSRSAENADTRLTWILGSGFLDAHDSGLINCPSTAMDANDYTGQTAADVLSDIAIATSRNFFAYWDETQSPGNQLSLYFDNSNTSTAYSSSLKLTNVLANVDNASSVWAAEGELTRDPSRRYKGTYMPYNGGATYRTRSSTPGPLRDGVAPNANVHTSAKANPIADQFLLEHAIEEDVLVATYEISAAHVNDLRVGQRCQVQFSHLPGYESYTWVRVVQRSVAQDKQTDQRYTVQVVLSPQETVKYAQFRAVKTGEDLICLSYLAGTYEAVAGSAATNNPQPVYSTGGDYARVDWTPHAGTLESPTGALRFKITSGGFDPYECIVTFDVAITAPHDSLSFMTASWKPSSAGAHPVIRWQVKTDGDGYHEGVDLDAGTFSAPVSVIQPTTTVSYDASRSRGTIIARIDGSTRTWSPTMPSDIVTQIEIDWSTPIDINPTGAFALQISNVHVTSACTFDYQFVDESGDSQDAASWLWDFGDGTGSTSQNPTHTYTGSGPWSVVLTTTYTDASTQMVTHTVTP